MEFHCKPPKELSLNGNISENWRKFKQSFDICLKASGNIEKSNEIKVAILLNIVGEDGIELYNSFNLQETERNDLTKVLQCFEEYCISKKNTAYESFKFFSRVQQEGENFESFLMEIKKLSQTCEFGIMTDRMIRDKIVQGIKDKVLQERLLKIEDLNVQKAIDYCRAAEASNIQARSLQENKTEIDNLHKEMLQEFNKIRGEEITQKFDCKRYETKHDPRGYLTSEEKRKQCSSYTRTVTLSPELAAFVGAKRMPQYRVLQKILRIIEERNLYDPMNKRFVICDEGLMKVIGVKRFRTFGMMKYLKNHFEY